MLSLRINNLSKFWISLVSIFILLLISQNALAKTEDVIRVGLMENQSKVEISADGDFVIKDLLLKKDYKFRAHSKPVLYLDNGVIKLGRYKLENNLVVAVKAKQPVIVNGKKYRGNIIIQVHPRGLTIINRLPMEDYLKGVVPTEMPPSWNKEALKAQAVAARTFAQYMKDDQKYAKKGFDVCSSSQCQVYKGISSETSATNQAINETKGQFLLYQNQPIDAVFHASSGGRTENSEDVWHVTVPYLRTVDDSQEISPYGKWVQKFDLAAFTNKLKKYYPQISNIKSVDFHHINNDFKGKNPKRGHLIIHTDTKSYEISPTKFREILSLPSAKFSISIEEVKAPTSSKNFSNTKQKNAIKKVDKVNTSDKMEINPQKKPQFIFTGSGYGHRLGLSQWGAKSLADKGANYKQILQHYYTNVKLAKLY